MGLFKGIKKNVKGKFGTSPAALGRREKNFKLLDKLKFPYNDELPLLTDNGLNQFQATENIAKRALCLFSLILLAHGYGPGQEPEKLEKWLKEHELWDELGADEQEFIAARVVKKARESGVQGNKGGSKPNQSEEEKASINEFKWKAESLWVLLWTLGLLDELPLPESPCNLKKMGLPPVLNLASPAPFIQSAKLRKDLEILRQTDLHLLINWTYADAMAKTVPPPKHFITGAVYERHFAFVWLSSPDKRWEEIELQD